MTEVEGGEVAKLPTEAAMAASLRADLAPLLEQVCVILNKGRAQGFIVNFSCGADQYGRHRPSPIDVLKPL